MTGASSGASTDETVALEDLAPSAKLVFKALEYEGDLTQSQLAESTLLPARTVRYALSELEDNHLVSSRISFVDARKRVYTLANEDSRREASEDGSHRNF